MIGRKSGLLVASRDRIVLRWEDKQADAPQIASIDRQPENRWRQPGKKDDDFWSISVVAVDRDLGRLAGRIVFLPGRNRIEITKIAVSRGQDRKAVVEFLLESMKVRAEQTSHGRIVAVVPEGDLDCQLAMSESGFRCTGIMRGRFFDRDERKCDGYRFEYPFTTDRKLQQGD